MMMFFVLSESHRMSGLRVELKMCCGNLSCSSRSTVTCQSWAVASGPAAAVLFSVLCCSPVLTNAPGLDVVSCCVPSWSCWPFVDCFLAKQDLICCLESARTCVRFSLPEVRPSNFPVYGSFPLHSCTLLPGTSRSAQSSFRHYFIEKSTSLNLYRGPCFLTAVAEMEICPTAPDVWQAKYASAMAQRGLSECFTPLTVNSHSLALHCCNDSDCKLNNVQTFKWRNVERKMGQKLSSYVKQLLQVISAKCWAISYWAVTLVSIALYLSFPFLFFSLIFVKQWHVVHPMFSLLILKLTVLRWGNHILQASKNICVTALCYFVFFFFPLVESNCLYIHRSSTEIHFLREEGKVSPE